MKQKKRKPMPLSRGERLCRSLLILVMVASALWGAWQVMVPKPAIADNVPPIASSSPGRSPEQGSDPVGRESGVVDKAYKRKDDYWTFLLIGMDRGSGNTDSLMLVSYDVANQRVSVGSIARDTCVDVERRLKKINAAFAYNGVGGLMQEVSMTFGIPIDFYLRVNINGFIRLVDAVDGIDFDVPCNMSYDDPVQDLSIHFTKGMQHLDGQQAVEVCRFRQNNGGIGYGDEGRQKTQRGVLTEVMKKVLKNPGKISEYAQIATENLDTNLSLSNIVWFGTKALSFSTENLNTMSMPCEWSNPYMYLDPDETLALVNEYFSPYVLPRTAEQLDIVTRR